MGEKSRRGWSKRSPPDGFRGIYINLDRNTLRRRNIERQLARLGLTDAYVRLPAVDGRRLKTANPIGPGALGCFRSHVAALELAAEAKSLVHIAEDDIVLTPHLSPFMRHVAATGAFGIYDIVFLDMWVDPVPEQVDRYLDAATSAFAAPDLGNDRFTLVDLKDLRIGAAASYLVAPDKREKVHALLTREMANGPALPVDSTYHRLMEAGAIRAAVVVPFVTGIDLAEGARSDIGTLPEREHRLYLLLRAAFAADRDLAGVVLPGMDEYLKAGGYRNLDVIRNRLAESAGLPVA